MQIYLLLMVKRKKKKDAIVDELEIKTFTFFL